METNFSDAPQTKSAFFSVCAFTFGAKRLETCLMSILKKLSKIQENLHKKISVLVEYSLLSLIGVLRIFLTRNVVGT